MDEKRILDQRGMTLLEALAVVALIGLITSAVSLGFSRWLTSDQVRGAGFEVFAPMNLARMEAMKRNRSVRLTVDTATRKIRVVDLNDPSSSTDDQTLQEVTLSRSVSFERPGGGAAVTTNPLSATLFETTFGDNGTVTSGVGTIAIRSGSSYKQVAVYAAGAVELQTWSNSAWVTRF